jgi:ribosomal protein L37AE/L43A
MKIKEIKSQHRRDFTAIYQCQFCGHTYEGSGYDDTNFHQNVVPDKKCEKCGKSTNSEPGEKPRAFAPRYPDGMEV